jgi:hypothetical protein
VQQYSAASGAWGLLLNHASKLKLAPHTGVPNRAFTAEGTANNVTGASI